MYCRFPFSIIVTTCSIATVLIFLHSQIYESFSGVNYITQRPVDYMSDLNKAKVAPDDKKLIELLRNYYIQPPSKAPYNISHPTRLNPSPGQTQFVDNLLNNMRNGFYVDCGAYDGEHLSNSLFLERFRNWTGILIEPNPDTFEILKGKNRKAYTLNACLSIHSYPASTMEDYVVRSIKADDILDENISLTVNYQIYLERSLIKLSTFRPCTMPCTSETRHTSFKMLSNIKEETFFIGKKPVLGKIVNTSSNIRYDTGKYKKVQCFPLYTVLLALKQPYVDYFSLDVEGSELDVLETIPLDKIQIVTFSIEHNKWKGGK